MTKREFIKKCTKLNLLVIVNNLIGSTELIDMSGKSDYHKVFKDDGSSIGWDTRFNEVKSDVELARKQDDE